MFNLFSLTGPEFLFFYIVLGIVASLLLKFLFQKVESCFSAALHDCSDPYELAALKGGVNETIRIALFSLIDRGLLKASGTTVTAEPQAMEMVSQPIERAVVSYFRESSAVQEFFTDNDVMNEGKAVCQKLAYEGLLSDIPVYMWRLVPALATLALLIWVSVTKMGIAMDHGKDNISFLAILTLAFTLWIMSIWHHKLTGAGKEVLQRARYNFEYLEKHVERVLPGGETKSAAIFAALFGVAALPTYNFPYVAELFPKAIQSPGGNGSSGGCGCGGGGCGGGGCGGGCGGCGGCGG